MTHITFFIQLCFLTFFTSCNQMKPKTELVNECKIPIEVTNFINKEYPRWSLIVNDSLTAIKEKYEKYSNGCYSILNFDFTNDGALDLICMMRDVDSIPNLVAINNYESGDINKIIIAELPDYGSYGIGSVIYRDSIGEFFYLKNLESSLAKITWNKDKYMLDYIND